MSSARKRGNCDDIAGRMLDALKQKGLETNLIHTADFDINPCKGCNYERSVVSRFQVFLGP